MVVGHDLSQGMIGDGIFEMSKRVRSAALPAGLSVVQPGSVVSHYQGDTFHFMGFWTRRWWRFIHSWAKTAYSDKSRTIFLFSVRQNNWRGVDSRRVEVRSDYRLIFWGDDLQQSYNICRQLVCCYVPSKSQHARLQAGCELLSGSISQIFTSFKVATGSDIGYFAL